ncbi:MAG: RHS repeat-associated core domain-containing protein [Velocimicrobium sp.]
MSNYAQYSALYDAYGNLRLQKNNATGIIQSKYYYNTMQRVTTSIDAVGNTIKQSYDPWGEVKEVMDATGNLYVNSYDTLNNKSINYFVAKNNISVYRANTSADAYKESYLEIGYDQFDQPIQKKVFEKWPTRSGELAEEYSYDIVGNLTSYTDPKKNKNADGVTVSYQYDALNRIVGVKNAENQMTNVSYTTLGEISAVTLNVGSYSTNIYTKSYDERGSIISKNQNANVDTSYSYNTIGLQTKTIDRNKNVQTLTYDGLNRLIEYGKTNSDGTKSVRYKSNYTNPFGYSNVQLYNNGRLTNQEIYNYDTNGQVTQRDSLANDINTSLNYQYDDSGRLLSVGAGVKDQGYFYSKFKYANNRLTKVQTNGQNSNSDSAKDNASYEYYPEGKLKKITYPQLNDNSFLTTEYSYNPIGRLKSVVNKKGSNVLSQFYYAYDANGNITSVNDGHITKNYVYDKLNQLVEIRNPDGKSIKYTYDYRGNRVGEVGGYFDMDLDVDFSYDLENKLKTVTKGTATTTMSYYADGMRAKKESKAGVTKYIYNLSGKLIAEAKNSSAITANYVWGPDRVISQKNSGGEYYYLYNGHGDVIQVVDRNGNIVNNYEYDEWGNVLYGKETVSNPFKYAGEVYDEETGLYYLRARYYDPKMGRFINEDTYEGQINDALSLNGYSYCNNNPLIHIDPSGHVPVETIFDVASIALSVSDFAKNPTLKNGAYLAWDVVAAALPYIPGSYVAKGGKALRKVDHAIDGAKAVSKADKVKDSARATQKILSKSKVIKGASNAVPEFGKKLEYVFGNATGNIHNIERSVEMERQLKSIGIFDNASGRNLVLDNLTEAYNNSSSILKVQENGRVVRESLLSGPNGLVKVESIWEGAKLITVTLFGGK